MAFVGSVFFGIAGRVVFCFALRKRYVWKALPARNWEGKEEMRDSRYEKLADLLVGYSVDLKKGDFLLIDVSDVPEAFTIALIRAARRRGAISMVETRSARIGRECLRGMTEAEAKVLRDIALHRLRKVQAYIAVRGAWNANENADVPSGRLAEYSRILRPAQNYRVNKTRWCVLRWPTPSMAQAAGMSTEAFEDFFFEVCTLDYRKMGRAMAPLARRMEGADQVRLKAPGTDLTFSIQGIGAQSCPGDRNIPDGEVFSCPVKHSVNGVIQFNAPTLYSGTRFENVRLEFRKGKIVNAAAGNHTRRLNEILDTDAGARYVGEFSLGLNPKIQNPMGDILFDEKIAGSLHFTPGQAYKECDNGNRSAVHWDMVLIQRPEWGGGEVWFDKTLIRRDGLFQPKDLQGLNPENLVGKRE